MGKINDTIKGHWEIGEHLQTGHNGQRHLIVRSEKMRKLWQIMDFVGIYRKIRTLSL